MADRSPVTNVCFGSLAVVQHSTILMSASGGKADIQASRKPLKLTSANAPHQRRGSAASDCMRLLGGTVYSLRYLLAVTICADVGKATVPFAVL